MNFFDPKFQTRLYETIAEIESESLVEIVVIIKAQSDTYSDRPVWAGAVFAALVFSFLMFSHFVFGDFLFYVLTVISFLLGYTLTLQIKAFFRKIVGERKMSKAVEIAARAIFQKGGIRHTEKKIGTLIYCSVFEQKVFVLPDSGAEEALPKSVWESFSAKLQGIFSEKQAPEALLEVLKAHKSVFSQYLPPIANDINELPDDLEVNL